MASAVLTQQSRLSRGSYTVRKATPSQRAVAIGQPRWCNVDTACGLVFMGVMGWGIWYLGVQFLQMMCLIEAQLATAGPGSLF